MVSVFYKHEHRNAFNEAADAVCSTSDSSANFPDPAFYVLIVEEEIFEESSP